MNEPMNAEKDPVQLRAAEWLMRLQEADVSIDDMLAWQSWLHADPRHADAFERMQDVALALRSLPTPPRARGSWFAADGYDGSIPLSQWRRPRRFAAIAAAAVMVIGIGIGWQLLAGRTGSTDVFATQIGENRVLTLADGSSVTLGGKTQLKVTLTATERRVELSPGEAFFRVAKDASRPFKVQAGDTTVVAVGTEFNVHHGEEKVVVSVLEGRVRVEPTTGIVPLAVLSEFKPTLQPVHVAAGQRTIADNAGIAAAERLADPTAATSWQSGRLAFRRQPLSLVLEDVNRYSFKPIVPADDAVGALRVTGTVDGDNVSGWLGSLESVFELEAVEDTQRIVLRRR